MTIPVGAGQVLIPLKHPLLSRSAAITFGVSTDTTTLGDLDLINAVTAAFIAQLGNQMDFSVAIGPGQISIGTSGGTARATVGTTVGAGGQVQTSVAPAVAFLIKKRTSDGGKRGRGRIYLPWSIATANLDEGGNIAAASVTAMQTKATAFLTAIQAIAGGVNMVVLHQSGVATPSVVSSLTADARAATQRRRQAR